MDPSTSFNDSTGPLPPETMTRRDALDLAAHARRQATVAKSMATMRAAELMADFEEQLAATYPEDDPRWADITAAAEAAVAAAQAEVTQRCRDAGIPERFAPRLDLERYGRGENGIARRRVELRAVAQTRIDAMMKRAKVEIDHSSMQVQTALLADGLTTEVARAFLTSMPTAADLMPRLEFAEIDPASRLGLGSGR